jgi:nucleotide-binding universal stress UspA family protein
MFTRILFATDGSRSAEHAQQAVIKLAGYGAKVRVVTVTVGAEEATPATYSGMVVNELVDQPAVRGEVAENILEKIQAELTEHGVAVDARHIQSLQPYADIPAAILQAADEWAADIIVVGTHGRSGFKRAILGSVAESLARQSPVPVLLAREQNQA